MEKRVMMPHTNQAFRGGPQHEPDTLGREDAGFQKTSQVEQAMTRISSLINSLEAKRGLLEDRLSPILTRIPPSPCDDGIKEDGGRSPIVCDLQQYGDKLQRILDSLEEMEGRIEL